MNQASNPLISDIDLIEGCIRGDRRMQEALYRQYAPRMFAICLRYAGSTEEAEDILQDGFVKVFRNIHRFRREGSFEGWMRRIFVNTAIEYYRRSTHTYPITDWQEQTLEQKEWNAVDRLSMKDLMDMVQQLAPGYRAVFNLYVIEGYPHKEIADMMGISEGTSKSQLARAKALLQEMIKKRNR